ncbi:restriction endonuclease subunit S [Bacteroides uniformis]|uniref:restriction endonuclease subunit S n=1 Tax=Bacteroides uniformis TaxID=820 RepID=UPI0023A959E9|nr:restriction endonuclease subunit S [Bacteroides uniformis]MDE5169316.1 restriction endonuclease subunit S [Bacteroides uniformis]
MAIDNKDKKILNVPHLRFPEFTEEWVNVSLKDVADFQKERISSGLLDESTYISTENILQNFQGVQSAISIPANTNVVAYKKNDILLSNIRPYLKKVWFSDRIGGCSADVFVLRSKTCEPEFLYNVIASDKFINYVMSGAKGVKMPRGDKNQMESFSFSIPAVVEQRKISRLFQLLDERIVTQNKIIEDLKKLKSAISKHLFARKDLLETTICLSNIATLKNGYAFQSGKYNALGKWKILTITNVSGERYINDEDYNCIINLPNDIQDHQVLKEGDILISLTGNVGRVSLCKDGDYLLNQRVGLLQLAKNVNQEFLYQILSSQRFENSMIACGQGAAQMNIGKGDVESYVLPYSSNVNNILLVAKILHSYDEYIINEQRKLTLLTMQKQYFLAQMFI